jgi:hypothetical protein
MKKTTDQTLADHVVGIVANHKTGQGFFAKSDADMQTFLGGSKGYTAFFYSDYKDASVINFDFSGATTTSAGNYWFQSL